MLVDGIVKPWGINTIFPDNSYSSDEDVYKALLHNIYTPAEKYSARMSARKMQPFQEYIENGGAVITLDTVVIEDETMQILEKPKTIDEARSTIHKLTSGGVVIHVSDGVTFALKLQNQKLFYWRTGAYVVLLIEEMTKREIDEYLEKEGERVLGVAGGVDFASDNGNKFIKKGEQLTCIVSKQNSGPIPSFTDTLSPQDVLDILESVRIAGEAEQTVLPYFKGVPTHLVREIVKNFSN